MPSQQFSTALTRWALDDGEPMAEYHALADAIDQLRMLQRARVRVSQPCGEEFLDVLHLELVALLRGSDDSTVI